MAFAASDAHARQHGPNAVFSAEYAFYYAAQGQLPMPHHDGVLPSAMYEAIAQQGQPDEPSWPYLRAADPLSPLVYPQSPANSPIFRRTPLKLITNSLADEIAKGLTPILVMRITQGFVMSNATGNLVKPSTTDSVVGNHAVIAVGTGVCSVSGPCIRIRNSWGPAWGDGGHCWLTDAYVQANLLDSAYFS